MRQTNKVKAKPSTAVTQAQKSIPTAIVGQASPTLDKRPCMDKFTGCERTGLPRIIDPLCQAAYNKGAKVKGLVNHTMTTETGKAPS